MSLKIRVAATGVTPTSRRLSLYGAKLKTWRSLYRRIGAEVVKAERAWFASQGNGSWPMLSEKYGAWKARHYPGRPILVREGDLKRALTSQAQFVEYRAPDVMILNLPEKVWYGNVHQTGNPEGNLPRRPPLIPLTMMRQIARRETAKHVKYHG